MDETGTVESQATQSKTRAELRTDKPLRIGITCYPTFGGSGVVATEIGMEMARRGHRVHFISYDIPRRLERFQENIFFHEVETRDYPLFQFPPYPLSLASKMVEVSTYEQLDLLHVHYAVPHATSAYLARQVLGAKAPKIITTLHGTDITLVGNDRSYLPITRFSIMQSDGITTPSRYLQHATYDKLNIPTDVPIQVIGNFVDTELFSPKLDAQPASRWAQVKQKACTEQGRVLVHVSNFRPLKRIGDIIQILARVNTEIPTHLILIGDGPERSRIEGLVHEMGLAERVCFLGKMESFVEVLQDSDVFLLPSETESFGLAALEAMSCGIPVVASDVHGIPEVVLDRETGFLAPVGAIDEMAQAVIQLLSDRDLYQRMSVASRERAVQTFSQAKMVSEYERYYRKILAVPYESESSR